MYMLEWRLDGGRVSQQFCLRFSGSFASGEGLHPLRVKCRDDACNAQHFWKGAHHADSLLGNAGDAAFDPHSHLRDMYHTHALMSIGIKYSILYETT